MPAPGSRSVELASQVFGRLTVRRFDHRNKHGRGMWLCVCECGTEKVIDGNALRSGATRSCGCLKAGIIGKVLHGRGVPADDLRAEYDAWAHAIRRTSNPNDRQFDRYGGRGIAVCDRWIHGEDGISGFECFVVDVGRRPSKGCSLDRYPDNDGDYRPGNVRWATAKQQAHNRSSTMQVTVAGTTKPLAEWCALRGIPYHRVYQRLKAGWSPEDALPPTEKTPSSR